MKELGLIFKAPTRKSVASGVSKHVWHYDEDTRLRELYDEHRLDDGKYNIFSFIWLLLVIRLPIAVITCFYFFVFLHCIHLHYRLLGQNYGHIC